MSPALLGVNLYGINLYGGIGRPIAALNAFIISSTLAPVPLPRL